MAEHDKVISVLNDLIETCKDGEQGFKSAAEAIKSDHLRSLFMELSRQRGQFGNQLQSEVGRLGGSPEKSGSVSGSVHRGWINLKAAIAGRDESSIVAECERGEDSAKDAYKKALENNDLPPAIRSIVEGQSVQVKEAHDRVRSLEIKLER